MSNDNTTWGDLGGNEYLNQDDLPQPRQLHISKFTREEIGQGDSAEVKTCVYWAEPAKPLVASKTAIKQIQEVTGAKLPADAIGKLVEVFVDKSVTFAGKVTGGIRIRAPQ